MVDAGHTGGDLAHSRLPWSVTGLKENGIIGPSTQFEASVTRGRLRPDLRRGLPRTLEWLGSSSRASEDASHSGGPARMRDSNHAGLLMAQIRAQTRSPWFDGTPNEIALSALFSRSCGRSSAHATCHIPTRNNCRRMTGAILDRLSMVSDRKLPKRASDTLEASNAWRDER